MEGSHEELRLHLPHIKIVQVVHVLGKVSIAESKAVSSYVDAILLDSGNPKLKIKSLGGTGKIHDWKISRIIRDEIKILLYLAGGLNSTNVQQAVAVEQPYGIDLCSGVRTNGSLDEIKLNNFFNCVKTLKRGLY